MARRRAVVALRGDVGFGYQRRDLCHARPGDGSVSRQALADRPRAVRDDFVAALRGRLSHDDLTVYNSVQRLLYAGVLLTGVVIVLSGLSIWKPIQFKYLTALFGGYDIARYVHFFAMAAIVAFLIIHVVLAVIVPKSLRAIILGR